MDESTKTAQEAVINLIKIAGDDPSREGLLRTPERVVKFYKEYFDYSEPDLESMEKKLEHNDCGQQLIRLKGVQFTSFCEHHIVPISGRCEVGYVPGDYLLGIGSIVSLIQTYAKRLQTQERMTRQIACSLRRLLKPVWIEINVVAIHQCVICQAHDLHSKPRLHTTFTIGVQPSDSTSSFT